MFCFVAVSRSVGRRRSVRRTLCTLFAQMTAITRAHGKLKWFHCIFFIIPLCVWKWKIVIWLILIQLDSSALAPCEYLYANHSSEVWSYRSVKQAHCNRENNGLSPRVHLHSLSLPRCRRWHSFSNARRNCLSSIFRAAALSDRRQ